jgi:hypothetical protein
VFARAGIATSNRAKTLRSSAFVSFFIGIPPRV